MTDVLALLGRGAFFRAPFRNSIFEGLPTDHTLQRRDLCLIVLKQISRLGVIIERPSLKLPHPDLDEVA